jgi:protein-S-isoprenylcysteine O-methyltransferase Ste14
VNLGIFIAGTLSLAVLSRGSFINQGSHGFPRFFAFEAILGLVVLNASAWFHQPFSLLQWVSWVLLLVSAFLVLSGIWALRRFGAPDRSIRDTSRISIEKTTRLVTVGPYRIIRHPMYASLLFLAWGIFLKRVNLVSFLLAMVASLALFLTAVYEERENLRNFGDEYSEYMRHTRRFVPYLF